MAKVYDILKMVKCQIQFLIQSRTRPLYNSSKYFKKFADQDDAPPTHCTDKMTEFNFRDRMVNQRYHLTQGKSIHSCAIKIMLHFT